MASLLPIVMVRGSLVERVSEHKEMLTCLGVWMFTRTFGAARLIVTVA